jgi:signal transduction histidine kinase
MHQRIHGGDSKPQSHQEIEEALRQCEERLFELEQATYGKDEAVNRIKNEFLSLLSHELRTPLTTILGWSSLLQTHQLSEAKTTEAFAAIRRNAELLSQLINDLLDTSKCLQGNITLNVDNVDLILAIHTVIKTIDLSVKAKSIDLRWLVIDEEASSPPLTSKFIVLGDATRLQQVIWNLVSNSIKFTPIGGRVEISLTQVNNYAQIQVSDTGKGINPTFLPHAFDLFRQADSSMTREFGGLGLGLTITRQIVELHGGCIYAESCGEGQGATFTIKLPLKNSGSRK